ncbi:glycoside hydrolase family protein [Nocardioides zhouii]|uniref:Lysozyme n=1 Tax=Nocardioides zhouii TaxID=1168729 RepID=A0A4V1RNB0_9ACTN|nr:hypothetical protein [Nocardioides zhouii]RYC05227.1 hypothetical protein EUA94_19865 [Nocardioides zhouii]
MTQNRFVEMHNYLRCAPPPGRGASRPVLSRPHGYASAQSVSRSMAATDRALVVLLDNGGVDLGLPALVDKILDALPGSSMIPSSVKRDIVSAVERKLREVTDNLLESAELALARYEKAKPGQYADVTVLRNSASLADDMKAKLFALGRAGKIIDVYVLTHGSDKSIAINDGGADITDTTIRGWKTEYGSALPLRSVYMMNCEASTLNQAWLDAGAKVVSGSVGLNVLPEPTTYFFWNNWKDGQGFDTAITGAYTRTVGLMNAAVRAVVGAVPVVGDQLAASIDVGTIAAIKSSAPVVKGEGSLTISSDALTFATSLGHTSMVTVVVPMSDVSQLGSRSSGAARSVSRAGMELIRQWEQGADVEQRVAAALRTLDETASVSLNQNQVDALACFICGIGEDPFRRSTLLRMLRDGAHGQVPAEMKKWVQARRGADIVQLDELLRRRQAEADLYARPPGVPSDDAVPALAKSVYESGGTLAVPMTAYSYAQNPLAGIAIADAIQIGLGSASIAQSALQAGGGGLDFTYQQVERLLTTQARLQMPGAAATKQSYKHRFLSLDAMKPGMANADLVVTWEGNAFGEISTVVMKKDLATSTDWTKAEGKVTVIKVSPIPAAGTDPRTWPITYRYEGSFDPVGNGKWEFEGEFEINAFGGFKVNNHSVVSRSLSDFLKAHDKESYVKRGVNHIPAVPPLPPEQLDYLRKNAP